MAGFSYKNGFWTWDIYTNALAYQSKDVQHIPSRISRVSTGTVQSISGRKNIDCEIRMMDTVDAYTTAKFKKYYQRKVKVFDVAVVTLQDVKDVAIFTSRVNDLYPEFISYFHTVAMDRFLRSLIVYFQYYLVVWNKMTARRKEAGRKLRQPIVTELENEVRDNLADLRSMVSRDHAAILMGIGDSKKFHHMNNKNNDSLSDKDRRSFETLSFMATKVVWIALFRKNLPLIEKEINRLLRTCHFSPVEHSGMPTPSAIPEEKRVLLGKAFRNEPRLLHRSPAVQEIMFDNHDYRLLSIGINDIPGADDRIKYLEIVYAAPEELLVELGVAVGILGIQRRYLDPMLKPRDISTTVKRTSVMQIGEFSLPPKSPSGTQVFSNTLSSKPCRYQESQATKRDRRAQCKKWRTYLDYGGFVPGEITDTSEIDSMRTIRNSVSPGSDLANM